MSVRSVRSTTYGDAERAASLGGDGALEAVGALGGRVGVAAREAGVAQCSDPDALAGVSSGAACACGVGCAGDCGSDDVAAEAAGVA